MAYSPKYLSRSALIVSRWAYLHHSRAAYCVRVKIDEDSPDYPYVQLASWLRAEIQAERIGPRLPSITEIAGESGLSPATVSGRSASSPTRA
jgi:hypothetical protein